MIKEDSMFKCVLPLSFLLLALASAEESQYQVGAVWNTGDSCDGNPDNRVARLCDYCAEINATMSVKSQCSPKVCEDQLFANGNCEGNPVQTRATPCDNSCQSFNVSGRVLYSKSHVVDVKPSDFLKDFDTPIVKTFDSDDCSGQILSYASVGGCKKIAKRSFATVCRKDIVYNCQYSDDACENESNCFPLKQMQPGKCLDPGKKGVSLLYSCTTD